MLKYATLFKTNQEAYLVHPEKGYNILTISDIMLIKG
jgi:hypothetical protein